MAGTKDVGRLMASLRKSLVISRQAPLTPQSYQSLRSDRPAGQILDELTERPLRPFDQSETRQLMVDEVDPTESRNSRDVFGVGHAAAFVVEDEPPDFVLAFSHESPCY